MSFKLTIDLEIALVKFFPGEVIRYAKNQVFVWLVPCSIEFFKSDDRFSVVALHCLMRCIRLGCYFDSKSVKKCIPNLAFDKTS